MEQRKSKKITPPKFKNRSYFIPREQEMSLNIYAEGTEVPVEQKKPLNYQRNTKQKALSKIKLRAFS